MEVIKPGYIGEASTIASEPVFLPGIHFSFQLIQNDTHKTNEQHMAFNRGNTISVNNDNFLLFTGWILSFSFRVRLVASCEMKLQDFPLVNQKCHVKFSNCKSV